MRALSAERAVVVLIDWQERLVAAMPEGRREQASRKAEVLLDGAQALGVPVLSTEQYPQGLGPTIAPLRGRLSVAPIEKRVFSCAGVPAFVDALRATGRDQVLLIGMEAHICVYQSARGLRELGFEVAVIADAALSRSDVDREVGLGLCAAAGSLVHTVESALFDALGAGEGPAFKAISRLVR